MVQEGLTSDPPMIAAYHYYSLLGKNLHYIIHPTKMVCHAYKKHKLIILIHHHQVSMHQFPCISGTVKNAVVPVLVMYHA